MSLFDRAPPTLPVPSALGAGSRQFTPNDSIPSPVTVNRVSAESLPTLGIDITSINRVEEVLPLPVALPVEEDYMIPSAPSLPPVDNPPPAPSVPPPAPARLIVPSDLPALPVEEYSAIPSTLPPADISPSAQRTIPDVPVIPNATVRRGTPRVEGRVILEGTARLEVPKAEASSALLPPVDVAEEPIALK